MNAPITALAPWAGSKRTLAPRIVELLGPHTSYIEPFCGSMAVLFAKPPARHEVVNDLNRDLVNIAVCVGRPDLAPELLMRLHFTICSEELYRASRERVMDKYAGELGNVDRAYHAMVTWWLGRNGCAGARKSRASFSARFSSRGGSGGVRFRNLVESVPAFTERLERVDVLSRDAVELIDKVADETGTAIYVDPPYLVKSFKYEHDFTLDDHTRLATALQRFEKARVVVSYYPHERLAELYPADRWTRLDVQVTKMIRNTDTRTSGGVKATEVLLVNGPAAPKEDAA